MLKYLCHFVWDRCQLYQKELILSGYCHLNFFLSKYNHKNFRGEAEEEWVTKKKVEITTTKERTTFILVIFRKICKE